MIVCHPKPVKSFPVDEYTWYDYLFVGAHRNCWIWHVVSDRHRRPDDSIRYRVECPDGTVVFCQTLSDAKMTAGKWDNGVKGAML